MSAYEQAGNKENLARAPLDPFYRKTVDFQLLSMPGSSN